jgi:addiction module HigA family antidote
MPGSQTARRRTRRPVFRPQGVPARVPPHPGRFLQKHYLGPLRLNQTETARVLGISRRRLNEILQGKRSMTPDTAIRCALAFRADVSFWLSMQTAWDSFQAWKSMRRVSAFRLPASAGFTSR